MNHPSEIEMQAQNKNLEIEVENKHIQGIDQKLLKKYIIYSKQHFGQP
jgi:DNA replicative helicase MCM subunit Mcm2 (Cdc46/Mcm family)